MTRSKRSFGVRIGVLTGASLLAAACVAALLSAMPAPALADDTSIGGIGGDYYPISSTNIRMESETVQAIVYRSYAEYKVDFLFTNSGSPQTLMLGFPFAVNPEDDAHGPIAFRAWQDGKPLPVSIGQGKPDSYESYYLHQATFPSGKTTITVRYLAEPSETSGSRFPDLMPKAFSSLGVQGMDESYDYWLHTGAGWGGTIGKAVVRFTLADDFRGYGLDVKRSSLSGDDGRSSLTSPETYTKLGDNVYQWVFTDLEPTEKDDIELAFTGLYWCENSPVPALMGPEVKTVTATMSGPPTTTQSGENPYWPLLEGSPRFALGLIGPDASLKLGIQGNQAVKEIRIVPGKNDSATSFTENGRPKTIKVTLSGGATSTIKLADEPTVQKFPLSGTAEWARLDIVNSYPGTKSTDVYIADVSFGNQPAPSFQSFDTLIAAAPGGTATSAPSASVTAGSTTSSGGAATSSTAPASTVTSAAPTTTSASISLGDDSAATGRTRVWTVWPIVLFSVAGVALIAAVVLTVFLLRRRGTSA